MDQVRLYATPSSTNLSGLRGAILTDIDLAVLIDPNTYRYLNASTVLDNGKFKFNPGKYSTDLVSDRAVEFLGKDCA